MITDLKKNGQKHLKSPGTDLRYPPAVRQTIQNVGLDPWEPALAIPHATSLR